jgi:glycosyltransferase involved in cell wall biosynthesis
MDKLVSVIMPVYNVEKYIRKSVQSVLNQTYNNFELLIIDDGSPDNSIDVVKQITDERIRIYHKKNGGLADALNFGLAKANGSYIYNVDSDDWMEPTLLEDCVEVMEEENLDVMIFGYYQDDEDTQGNLIRSRKVLPVKKTFYKKDNNLEIDRHHLRLLGYSWNKLYRKSFLVKHQFWFENGAPIVHDLIFNSQVFNKTDKLRFVDKAFYHYSNRPVVTLTKKFHQNSFDLAVKKTKYLKVFFDSWNMSEEKKNEALSLCLIGGVRYTIHNLFSFKNELSFSEKKEYIKKMLDHALTKNLIDFYQPKSLRDQLYKIMIKNKNSLFISLVGNIIK